MLNLGLEEVTVSIMKSTATLCVCAAFAIGLIGRALAKDAPFSQPAATDRTTRSSSAFSDEGTFGFYLNEDRIAVIRFKLSADGSLDNRAVLTVSGQSMMMTTRITPDEKGEWRQITMQSPAGPVSVTRDGNQARTTARGQTQSTELKPGALLFENFSPELMSCAIRTYDRAKAGKQTFPLFIIPGAMTTGSLELKETAEKSVAGKDLQLDRFIYSLAGVDVSVWADRTGKVYLGDVASQHAAYVREGYEILRKQETSDPLLSKPTFAVKTERNVRLQMRDGTLLATDIYRPDADGKFPVVLVRTPYDRRNLEMQADYYARRGYVYAGQDCRGRFGSQGAWEPFVNEKTDGYDTIEWLAEQSWSNGKVAMIGGSYLGWVQWFAATQRPPHLVTIIPNVAPPEPFYNIPYEHGVFFLGGAIWWADFVESTAGADLSAQVAAISNLGDKKYHELLQSLPVIDLDKKVLGKENRYWRAWIEHWTDDDYWKRADFYDELKDIDLPVFHQSGWFDGDGIGSKLNYQKMTSYGHQNQKLVLGPWGHTDTDTRMVGEWDFGPQAIVDLQRQYLRWFDYWLKGVDNGITKEPLVSIFVMGSNRWLRDNAYPISGTRFEKWYLSSDGGANTSGGDGKLGPDAITGKEADHYSYDPGDPTPTPDDYVPADEQPADAPPASGPASRPAATQPVKSSEEEAKLRKTYHAKVIASRRDILVYTSAPMEKPLTIAGPLSAVLYAASSKKDTDWFVRLIEVNKDGQLWTRGEGRLRARFRDSNRRPELLKPGEIYEYHLDLWQTGVEIPAGNRLRVEVCSASFPFFSRNLNTGGHSETETNFVTAQQTIYHDPNHPSHVLLPVIPAEVLARQGK